MVNRLSAMSVEERRELIQVVRGEQSPTKWIRKARYANLVTGELEEGEILLHGRRIAYVGKKEPHRTEGTEVIDGQEYTIVPGYIEPHAHPFQLYHPLTLADFALRHGTTLLVSDNMVYFHLFSPKEVVARMEEMAHHPVKFLWWVRLSPQSGGDFLAKRYSTEVIRLLAEHPLVYQGGEVTDLLPILRGEEDPLAKIQILTDLGKRVEGHAPGASVETLTSFSLAGITADHEAINGEEVLRRLRLGLYCPLRHSSIRRDLPVILQGLKELRYGWERLMFTTDGSTPPFLRHGLTDHLLRVAMEEGMEPLLAYRIASLHPASYYRIDGEVGMIAPGRLADLNFLTDLRDPTPARVMVEGELLLPHERPREDKDPSGLLSPHRISVSGREKETKEAHPISQPWNGWPDHAEISPDKLGIPWEDGKPFPVVHFLSDVITAVSEMVLPVHEGRILLDRKEHKELLYAALIDREGHWITKGIISRFASGLPALASSYTASQDILLIGCDPTKMAEGYRLVREKPGIHLYAGGGWKSLPLPIEGFLSNSPMERLIEESEELERQARVFGFPHHDFYYALLFFTSMHLPKVRFTEKGIRSVKDGRLILPSTLLSAPL